MDANFLLLNFGGWGVMALFFGLMLRSVLAANKELMKDLRNHLKDDAAHLQTINASLTNILQALQEHNRQAAERHQIEMGQLSAMRGK